MYERSVLLPSPYIKSHQDVQARYPLASELFVDDIVAAKSSLELARAKTLGIPLNVEILETV